MVAHHPTYDNPLAQVFGPADLRPDDLASVLVLTDYEPLFERLRAYNRTGRPPFCVRAMWRAWVSKYLLNLRYNVELVALLRSNPAFRDACGFSDASPNTSVVCRFFRRLTAHADLVADAAAIVRDRLTDTVNQRRRDDEPLVGRLVTIDSTDIEAFVDTKRKPYSDPDARWGVRTPKVKKPKADDDKEYFFGYKSHAVCDGYYGIPLGHVLLPANANDSPQLPLVFNQVQERHPKLPMRYAMADRGYDAGPNYRYLEDNGVVPIIHIRNTDKDGLFDTGGRPQCFGGRTMQYAGTDRERGHRFRCPPEGCRLKNKVITTRYCDIEYYERPEQGDTELLRKVGRVVPRAGRLWRRLYRRRPIIERLFNSMKASRLLNSHRYRNRRKVALHAALSEFAYLATMLSRALAGDLPNLRIMRIRLPKADAADSDGRAGKPSGQASVA